MRWLAIGVLCLFALGCVLDDVGSMYLTGFQDGSISVEWVFHGDGV
jgi:hypothetical protein